MYAGYKEEQMTLETIVIFGLDMKPSSVKMNGILVVLVNLCSTYSMLL
jgi:hypothetical protein